MIGTEEFLREVAREMAADAVRDIGETDIARRFAAEHTMSPGEVAHVHALLGDIASDVERWQG